MKKIYILIALFNLGKANLRAQNDFPTLLKVHKKMPVSQIEGYSNEGYYSDFHKEKTGKIVFLNKYVKLRDVSQEDLKSEFSAGDFIYGRAFFEKGIGNYPVYKENESYSNFCCLLEVKVYADGKQISSILYDFTHTGVEVKPANTSLKIKIFPSPEEVDKPNGRVNEKLLGDLAKLAVGKHTIKLEIYARGKEPEYLGKDLMASGEFIYNADPKVALKQNYNIYNFDFPRNMVDHDLEKTILNCEKGFGNNPLAVTINSSDWTIVNDIRTGAILGRYVTAFVQFKEANGCNVIPLHYYQQYNGSGYNKSVALKTTNEEGLPWANTRTPVDCEVGPDPKK